MAISGFNGPEFWQKPVAAVFGPSPLWGSLHFIDLWTPMLFFSFFAAHLPACIYNVVEARRKANLPIAPIFLDWIPIVVYTGAICAWLGSPYSSLLDEQHLILFCLTMSFVFGRMTTKIILAHLTRQPFPYWTVMLLPLLGGAALANLPRLGYTALTPQTELLYLRLYFGFAAVVYFRWAYLVINSICAYLDINCLTITPKGGARGSRRGGEAPADGSGRRKVE